MEEGPVLPLPPVGISASFILSLLILGAYAVPVSIKTWGRPWSCLAEPGVFKTSRWVRQVHSNCPGGSRAVPWEPFGLNVENSGRLLGGGSPGIGASSKLGRRKGLGRAHRFGGCPLPPTTAEPTSCLPGSCPSPPPSHLCITQQHLRRRCHNRIGQPHLATKPWENLGQSPEK